jgi:hypothetical protein
VKQHYNSRQWQHRSHLFFDSGDKSGSGILSVENPIPSSHLPGAPTRAIMSLTPSAWNPRVYAILNREIVAAIRVRDSDIVAYQVSEVQPLGLNFHFVFN